MIEFKQIIGRGTRLYDGKDYFTVHDYVKAYKHFADPEWDGEPLEPEDPKPPVIRKPCKECGNRPCTCEKPPPEPCPVCGETECSCNRKSLIRVKLSDGKYRQIQHMTHTSFWSPDGTPLSSTEFLKKLFGDIPDFFKNEQELRELWSHPDTRGKLLEGLAEKGYGTKQLGELASIIQAENSDIFDVLAHVAYSHQPVTREHRVSSHIDLIHSHYDSQQQAFIDFVLSSYIKDGVTQLAPNSLGSLLDLKYGGLHDAAMSLGEAAAIRDLFMSFQRHLFSKQESA
jgi:type I restriction enzyme R subunit